MLDLHLFTGRHNELFTTLKNELGELDVNWLVKQASLATEGKSIIRAELKEFPKDITIVLSPTKYKWATVSSAHAKSYRSLSITKHLRLDFVKNGTRVECYY